MLAITAGARKMQGLALASALAFEWPFPDGTPDLQSQFSICCSVAKVVNILRLCRCSMVQNPSTNLLGRGSQISPLSDKLVVATT